MLVENDTDIIKDTQSYGVLSYSIDKKTESVMNKIRRRLVNLNCSVINKIEAFLFLMF